MAISLKNRKLLWGRSGNRCAICKKELVVEATTLDEESIIGEECHIVSPKTDGPRYRPETKTESFNSYHNLILLCCIHHKIVDDQIKEYHESKLLDIKKKHEQWVKDSLEQGTVKPLRLKSIKGKQTEFLIRIPSGKVLLNIISGTYGSYFDHPEPNDESEMELFSSTLQNIQDWSDIGSELDVGERVKTGFYLSTMINELEESGFWLFGSREQKILTGGIGSDSLWQILHISIVRSDNPEIVSIA